MNLHDVNPTDSSRNVERILSNMVIVVPCMTRCYGNKIICIDY